MTLYLVKHAEDKRYKKRMYRMCFLAWTIKTITIILCYHVRGSFYAIVVKKKKKKKAVENNRNYRSQRSKTQSQVKNNL